MADGDRDLEPIKRLVLNRDADEFSRGVAVAALATESADLEALAVFQELRRAYDEGLIDPQHIGSSELNDVETSPRGDFLERMKDRSPDRRCRRGDIVVGAFWSVHLRSESRGATSVIPVPQALSLTLGHADG